MSSLAMAAGPAAVAFMKGVRAGSTGPMAELPEERMAALGAALVDMHLSAALLWRPVKVQLRPLAEHFGRCVAMAEPGADPLEAVLRLHTSDLYLAYAAGSGAGHAQEAFARHCHEAIAQAVRTIDDRPAFADEIRQILNERLLLPTEGEPPRLLQYAGRAALTTWVSVAAKREALGQNRKEAVRLRHADQAGDWPLEMELDPELEYLKRQYRGAFNQAVSTALSRLSARERTVIRLQTVSGLTLARIAKMLSVDESTVSRWAQRARQTVREETEKELGGTLGIRVSELPSLARLVTSQLEVSVARLLTEDPRTRE
jgi:RNA polymerase sigma-70 factor (ECF subfamily)